MSGPAPTRRRPLVCRFLGCRWDFEAEDSVVTWKCGRGCGAGGHREFAGPEQARRMLVQLDRGRPGPPIGLLSALAGTVPPTHRRRGR